MKRKSSWSVVPYAVALVGLGLSCYVAVCFWQSGSITHDTPAVGTAPRRDIEEGSWGESSSSEMPVDTRPSSAVSDSLSRAGDAGRQRDPHGLSGAPGLRELSAPRFFAQVAPPVADRTMGSPPQLELPAPSDARPEMERPAWEVARRVAPRPETLYSPRQMQLPRQTVIREGVSLGAWPRPAALLEQLQGLLADPLLGDWARHVLTQLEQLSHAPSLSFDDAAQILDRLERAAWYGQELVEAQPVPDVELAKRVTRACHGIARRLEVWRRVHYLVQEERTSLVSFSSTSTLDESLSGVRELLNSSDTARTWNRYLLLDQLRSQAQLESDKVEVNVNSRRALARRVLERMASEKLSVEQRQFLERPEIRQLADHMRLWAYEPLDYTQFLRRIEDHEIRMADGTLELVEDWQSLRWSPWEQTSELARILDAHYRNANLRLSVSSEMINRMLPEVMVSEEDVNDQILGARVNGRSSTFAQLSVILIPDELRLRLGLVARGHVASRTRSAKGPVTFFNNGATRYRAGKVLTVDGRGVRLEDTLSTASSDSRLINVASDFDGVPLIGSLVRTLAVREHNGKMPEARAEVEFKVGSQAAQRLDREVIQKLSEAERQYQEKLVDPLNRLLLNPAVHDMQTTEHELIVRYRLAADHQLAACTPRPTPPKESWFSLQLNESALNNLLAQLRLEGRRQEVGEWMGEIAEKLQLPSPPRPEQLDQEVYVEFADKEPVHVRLDDGHVELTLRFASLAMGRNSWNDFEVRTRFAPQVSGRGISLIRDDFIEIRGPRLGFRDRLPLRGIFTALFTKERTLTLVGEGIQQDSRLEGIQVIQCVLRDGWWGLAYGPSERIARQPTHFTLGDLTPPKR